MDSTMVSPSSVTVRRRLPLRAACEGPRCTGIGEVGISASSASGSVSGRPDSVIRARIDVLAADVRLAHGNARAPWSGTGAADEVWEVQLWNQRLPLAHRVVLAQREALELGVHEEARQVRVPGELDPEHVVDVPLPPVGGAVERSDRVHVHAVAAQLYANVERAV